MIACALHDRDGITRCLRFSMKGQSFLSMAGRIPGLWWSTLRTVQLEAEGDTYAAGYTALGMQRAAA